MLIVVNGQRRYDFSSKYKPGCSANREREAGCTAL